MIIADSAIRGIDLHAHTTASDGDQSPTDLVRLAREAGLAALGVTDHDTTAGLAEATQAGKTYGVEIVPGVELSAEVDRGQCHLLGYLIDPDAPELLTRLQHIRDHRDQRNAKIVARFRDEIGFDITLEEVEAVAGGAVVARPHFARVLLDRGYVKSMQEAFDEYLANGARAYVDRDRLQPGEAIDLIHRAGGLAILAHPNNLKRTRAGTENKIASLKSLGLDGIEARYNRHTPEDTSFYLDLARRMNLLTSGGSDYHGPSVKATVFLGHVEGEKPAPYAVLDALRRTAAARNQEL